MAGPGQARFYSSTAVQTSLAAGISNSNTSCQVNSVSGFPASTPFVMSLDQNSLAEELILVTNVSGTTLTITRGFNGTSAVAHNNGASAVHVMCAQDLTDASAHIGAFDAVHGTASGSLVVGTNDTQTLTNKTLTSPTINTPTITSPTITGTATTGPITATGLVTATDLTALGLTGATAASRYVGATTGGAPASGTFAVGDFIIDNSAGLIWVCTTAGSPGTWVSLVNLASTQTLSNKTLAAPAFTGLASGVTGLFTGQVEMLNAKIDGITGAASAFRIVGSTASLPPTSGTFILGDMIIDQAGNVWICTTAGTPGTWTNAFAGGFKGAGQSTNITTGGSNRTATQAPFHYTNSTTITTTAGSGWSATFSDATFHGVGSFHVTPASNLSSLGFLTIVAANCSISGGQLTLGGAAFQPGGTGVATSVNINVNFSVMAW